MVTTGYILPWKIQPVCFPIWWRLSHQATALHGVAQIFFAVDQPDTFLGADEVQLYPAAVI